MASCVILLLHLHHFSPQTVPGLPDLLRLPVPRLGTYLNYLQRLQACSVHAGSKASKHESPFPKVLKALKKHQDTVNQVEVVCIPCFFVLCICFFFFFFFFSLFFFKQKYVVPQHHGTDRSREEACSAHRRLPVRLCIQQVLAGGTVPGALL